MRPILPLHLTSLKPKHFRYPKAIITVGDELRKVRMDRKLTQHQVAKMIKVNRNFVYEMELGHHTNTIFALHKVYLLFGFIPKTLKVNESTLRGKIFAHRIVNGLTYNSIANKIGVDKSTIARFERGKVIKKETEFKIKNYVTSLKI